MAYLTNSGNNLFDIVTAPDEYYIFTKEIIARGAKSTTIFENLDRCRELIKTDSPGSNILRYLLLRLNNKVVKQQYYGQGCFKLSGLYLSYKCIPFDEMPFNSSLVGHNVRILDIFESVSPIGREHELLAKAIQNNTEKHSSTLLSFLPCFHMMV